MITTSGTAGSAGSRPQLSSVAFTPGYIDFKNRPRVQIETFARRVDEQIRRRRNHLELAEASRRERLFHGRFVGRDERLVRGARLRSAEPWSARRSATSRAARGPDRSAISRPATSPSGVRSSRVSPCPGFDCASVASCSRASAEFCAGRHFRSRFRLGLLRKAVCRQADR